MGIGIQIQRLQERSIQSVKCLCGKPLPYGHGSVSVYGSRAVIVRESPWAFGPRKVMKMGTIRGIISLCEEWKRSYSLWNKFSP